MDNNKDYHISKIILESCKYYKEKGKEELEDLFIPAHSKFKIYLNNIIDEKKLEPLSADIVKKINDLKNNYFPVTNITKFIQNEIEDDNLSLGSFEKRAIKNITNTFWKFLYVLGRFNSIDKYNDRKKTEDTQLNGIIENIYENNKEELSDFDLTLYEIKIKSFIEIRNNIKRDQKTQKDLEKKSKQIDEDEEKNLENLTIIGNKQIQADNKTSSLPDIKNTQINDTIDAALSDSDNTNLDFSI